MCFGPMQICKKKSSDPKAAEPQKKAASNKQIEKSSYE